MKLNDPSGDQKEISFIQKVLILCLAVVAVYLILNVSKVWTVISNIVDIFIPLIIGICIAFVLNPLVDIYKKLFRRLFKKIFKKETVISEKIVLPISIFLAIVSILLVLGIVIFIAVPEIRTAIEILSETLPNNIQSLLDWIYTQAVGFGLEIEHITIDTISWTKIGEYLSQIFTTGSLSDVISNIPGAVASVAGVLFNIIIGIVFAISILGNKARLFAFIKRFMHLYFKPITTHRVAYVTNLVTDSFRNFVTGQLTEAFILFILCMIGMFIFGFPYAVAVSAIVAITALIPMFGAWIGGIIGALLTLTVSPLKMFLFVVFLVVLNLIDNYIVYPRIVGSQLSMPPLIVMISVVCGGNIAGIIGMIFIVPIVSVIYEVIHHVMDKRELKLTSISSSVLKNTNELLENSDNNTEE